MSPLLESLIYVVGGLVVGWLARHRGVLAPVPPTPAPAPSVVATPAAAPTAPLLNALQSKLNDVLEGVVDDLLHQFASKLVVPVAPVGSPPVPKTPVAP